VIITSTYEKLLLDQRQRLWEQMKALTDRAAAEHRDLTAEEDQTWERLTRDLDDIDERLQAEQQRAMRDREAQETIDRIKGQPATRGVPSLDAGLADEFRHRIRTNSREPIEILWDRPRSGYQPGIERRDLLTSSGGGMTGTTFYGTLLEHLVEGSAILAAGATLVTTDTGERLAVPRTTAMSTASIVAEGAQIPESDPTLGSVTLEAYKYGFTVQVSNELANDATFDLIGYLAREAGTAIANGAGAHFVAGTGTGQPNGVVGAATAGKTGANGVGGAFTADDLIDTTGAIEASDGGAASSDPGSGRRNIGREAWRGRV
jgi:HK97 family phage major capsid protein